MLQLFPNISVCYGAIKERQAIVEIFKVFWSLLSVKALKLSPQSCNRIDASESEYCPPTENGQIQMDELLISQPYIARLC